MLTGIAIAIDIVELLVVASAVILLVMLLDIIKSVAAANKLISNALDFLFNMN